MRQQVAQLQLMFAFLESIKNREFVVVRFDGSGIDSLIVFCVYFGV